LGKAEVPLPGDGPPKDEVVKIATTNGAQPAIIHIKAAWTE
jgi:hypothetical protein